MTDEDKAFSDAFAAFADGDTPPAGDDTNADENQEADTTLEQDADEEPAGEVEADDVADDEAPGGDDEEADPWAEAPDSLREEHLALQKQYSELDHRYRSEQGRVPTLNREYSKAKTEITQLRERLAALEGAANTGSNGNDNKDQAEDEAWQSLREEYPEIAQPLEAKLANAESSAKALEQRLADLDADKEEAFYNSQRDSLSDAHPDWVDVANSGEFHSWVATQPSIVQEALSRNAERIENAEEAGFVIEQFKRSQEAAASKPENQSSAKRNLQRKSAAAPSSRGVAAGGEGPKDDFSAAFQYYAKR